MVIRFSWRNPGFVEISRKKMRPCSDQNHKSNRNFADDQKAAKPLATHPASVTARAGAQCCLQISRSGAQSGEEPERNGDR